MNKPLLCLNMIVKNEADIIENTLMNIISKIPIDYWVISDTGSTDGTQDIINSFFNFVGIKGELYEDKWVDFAYNRTKALEYAYNKSKYLMVFDADDKIIGNITLPKELTKDGYIFQMRAGNTYFERIFIVNNSIKWNYKGVLHEHIFKIDGSNSDIEIIKGDYYIAYNGGGKSNRNKDNKQKYKDDALILERAYNEAIKANDPIYKRYTYYLAQSLCWAGEYSKAIEWYKKCLEIDLWDQEKYIACLNIYECYTKLNNESEGLPYLLQSIQYDKTRVECIYHLIKYYTIKNMHIVAYELYNIIKDIYNNNSYNILAGKLLVDYELHNFYLPYYMIIVVSYVNKYDIGLLMYKLIFKNKIWPIANFYIDNMLYNINIYLDKITTNIDKEEFLILLREYLIFLNKNNYKIADKNKSLLEKLIRLNVLEPEWINK
jgi:hypothetical protein